jgi:hypothetical protein
MIGATILEPSVRAMVSPRTAFEGAAAGAAGAAGAVGVAVGAGSDATAPESTSATVASAMFMSISVAKA